MALHEALGIPAGGASPRGSTYYKTFQHCPREFFIRYHLGWVPETPSDPLTTGLLWHHCLELYYSTMMTHQLATPLQPSNPAWLWGGCNEGAAKAYAALDRVVQIDGYHEIAAIVRGMLDVYLDTFDRHDRIRIFAVEETLQYLADDPYTCRADMIVEDYDRGGMWFWEHKSARALTADLLDAYDMDLQILGEWWLISNVLDLGEYPPLRGVVVNITTKPNMSKATGQPGGTVKCHRHDVCPSAGHVRAFERTIGTRRQLLEAAERAGWPQYFGNCAGASRGYSKCEFYELCRNYPDYDATRLRKTAVGDFPGYALVEGTVDHDDAD
jgi:hypothetical protein